MKIHIFTAAFLFFFSLRLATSEQGDDELHQDSGSFPVTVDQIELPFESGVGPSVDKPTRPKPSRSPSTSPAPLRQPRRSTMTRLSSKPLTSSSPSASMTVSVSPSPSVSSTPSMSTSMWPSVPVSTTTVTPSATMLSSLTTSMTPSTTPTASASTFATSLSTTSPTVSASTSMSASPTTSVTSSASSSPTMTTTVSPSPSLTTTANTIPPGFFHIPIPDKSPELPSPSPSHTPSPVSYTCAFLSRLHNIAFSATTAVTLRVNGADIGLSTSAITSSGTCNGVVNAWVQLQAGDVITLEADPDAMHDIKASGGFAAIVDVESILTSNSATIRVAKADDIDMDTAPGATTDDGESWRMPDHDACEWKEAYELNDIEVGRLCKPLMWGTTNWEFSSGAKYVWYPDQSETNIYMRLKINDDSTSPNCATPSAPASPSPTPSLYAAVSSPEVGVEAEQTFMFAIDAQTTATIWKNAAYLSTSGGNCSAVDHDIGYYPSGTVIGFSIVGGTAGIFGLSGKGFASGREVVRIMPVSEVDNSADGRGAWLSPGFDACHWTEATAMDDLSERWCKAEHYGSSNPTLWELPADAKYVWFPGRATQDMYVRIEIGEDCDSKRVMRTGISEMKGERVSKQTETTSSSSMGGNDRLNSVFKTSRTEGTVSRSKKYEIMPKSMGNKSVSTLDRQLRHENLTPVSAAFLTDTANTFACSPNGVVPVAFSAGGKAALYVNGHSVAVHDTGCTGYTQAYVPVGPGTVIGFIAVGGPGERGLIAAVGGWYVTGFNAGFRVIDRTVIDRTIEPLSLGYTEACQWPAATIAEDMTFCSATVFPYESGAQYVWAERDEMGNEVDSIYVRMQIGEGCLTTINIGGKILG